MKKLFLALALFGFIAFGVVGIQDIQASAYSVEVVDIDKDPTKDKDGDKKAKDAKASKDMKASSSSKDGCCASSCASKADCCSKASKSSCSKEGPDKK
jgi:hypothetical protein